MASPLIEYSSLESELFHIKMGRLALPALDQDSKVVEKMLEDRYDMVRLQLLSDDPAMEIKLKRLGIPYSISGIVNLFLTPASAFDLKPTVTEGVIFEPYSNRWKSEMKRAIEVCFHDQATGFYDVPYLRAMVSSEVQIEALARFLIEKLENDPSYVGWVALLDGEFAGYAITTNEQLRHFTISGGVLPEFRNRKLFKDIVRLVQNHGRTTNLDTFSGVRLQNLISQKHLLSEGMKPYGSKIVYYLCPFFNIQSESSSFFKKNRSLDPIQCGHEWIRNTYKNKQVRSLQYTCFKRLQTERFSFKVLTTQEDEMTAVMGFFDESDQIAASLWIELEPF